MMRDQVFEYVKKKYKASPKRYPHDRFTFDRLGRDYGIFAVRGPRGIPEDLSKALKETGMGEAL